MSDKDRFISNKGRLISDKDRLTSSETSRETILDHRVLIFKSAFKGPARNKPRNRK